MADIKALGSEKLDGLDKIKRIMEIAKYNEVVPQSLNETSKQEYEVTFADGNRYGIVKERQGYIIKKILQEGENDYIEPIKNRKYFSSYSQALKKLNLMIKENNSLIGNEDGISLFGEQKKFVLKTPQPAAPEVEPVAPTLPEPELPPTDASAEAPAPEAGMEPSTDEAPPTDEMPASDEMDMSADMSAETSDSEPITFKVIQKLTGKLTQKIRQFSAENEMSSEDIKYVINMLLSSVDLASLSTEDKDEIMGKFESDEADAVISGGDDKDGTDITDDTEVEDIQNYMDVENDADMVDAGAQKIEAGEQWQAAVAPAIERLAAGYVADKAADAVSNMFTSPSEGEVEENKTEKSLLDHLFSESKVDKVLSKYFEVSESEKKILEAKKIQKRGIVEKKMDSVRKLSVTIEQELAAEKFLEENLNFEFVGKTNKKNLVFESNNKQTKISPEGIIV